jgi:hypothetical protein
VRRSWDGRVPTDGFLATERPPDDAAVRLLREERELRARQYRREQEAETAWKAYLAGYPDEEDDAA